MGGDILPLPQYVFTAWYLVKDRDNFTFSFIISLIKKYGEVRYSCANIVLNIFHCLKYMHIGLHDISGVGFSPVFR
jgi:hypothetical protein